MKFMKIKTLNHNINSNIYVNPASTLQYISIPNFIQILICVV